MRATHAYHRRRKLVEESMAADATSSVARIAHGKLAVLHGQSAARAAAALALAPEGEAPRVASPAI